MEKFQTTTHNWPRSSCASVSVSISKIAISIISYRLRITYQGGICIRSHSIFREATYTHSHYVLTLDPCQRGLFLRHYCSFSCCHRQRCFVSHQGPAPIGFQLPAFTYLWIST